MCGIVGATGPKRAFELAQLVKDRGTKAWSMSLIDLSTYTFLRGHYANDDFTEENVTRALTDWGYSALPAEIDPFFIIHLQSPTARDHRFHPAEISVDGKDHFLWHNGMIDSSAHSKIEGRPWDTKLILEKLIDPETNTPDYNRLNDFEGSFACYYLESGVGLTAFRNAISPQFMAEGEFCSVKFDDAVKINPNVVYRMFDGAGLSLFDNKYNPFGV